MVSKDFSTKFTGKVVKKSILSHHKVDQRGGMWSRVNCHMTS